MNDLRERSTLIVTGFGEVIGLTTAWFCDTSCSFEDFRFDSASLTGVSIKVSKLFLSLDKRLLAWLLGVFCFFCHWFRHSK